MTPSETNTTHSHSSAADETEIDARRLAEAKAQLESDVERLSAALAAERFCAAVVVLIAVDAYCFQFYKTWGAPVSLVAIEIAGLFVLARRLGVDELAGLVLTAIRSFGRGRETDPKG